MTSRLLAFALLLASAAAHAASVIYPPQPGSIAGRVIVGPGVPAPSCQLYLEGSPLGGQCNADGSFVVKRVPSGEWTLDVVVPGLPTRKIFVSVNAGLVDSQNDLIHGPVVYLGELQVGQLGAVTGLITLPTSSDLDSTVVGIPALGLYTQPGISGNYLLTGVAPGTWSFVFYIKGAAHTRQITVPSGGLLAGNDWTVIGVIVRPFSPSP